MCPDRVDRLVASANTGFLDQQRASVGINNLRSSLSSSSSSFSHTSYAGYFSSLEASDRGSVTEQHLIITTSFEASSSGLVSRSHHHPHIRVSSSGATSQTASVDCLFSRVTFCFLNLPYLHDCWSTLAPTFSSHAPFLKCLTSSTYAAPTTTSSCYHH